VISIPARAGGEQAVEVAHPQVDHRLLVGAK
jgi:hypothetical protein